MVDHDVQVTSCKYSGSETKEWQNHPKVKYDDSMMQSTFLRTDIPRYINCKKNKYVLYTDVDVIFKSNPQLENIKPFYFTAAPETPQTHSKIYINAGVMVLNVETMSNTYHDFFRYMHSQNWNFKTVDQDALRFFYRGLWEDLPLTYNWKPYWGINESASIIHYHGIQPDRMVKCIYDPSKLPPIIFKLYQKMPKPKIETLRYYLNLWHQYTPVLYL
jgi:lipopolysaccharide biosynthesis glycosyltransferase